MDLPVRTQEALRKAFLAGCDGKRAYTSMGHAFKARDKASRRVGIEDCQPYKCQFCGDWHLGHNRFLGKP